MEQPMKSKPLNLLARLFGRSQSPLVAQVYAQAFGQPLLVHPQMGEQIIGGYLSGAVEARPPTIVIGELAPATKDEFGKVVTPARNVAVLNVSGGLVNRYEGGFCDPGPLSYQELRSSYDRARTDSSIETIVVRIESPGGMGSALFDLTDHIYATRGEKRVVAVIDDYAYSAAYAVAASCGEIWITRTGGGGSVGVIAYHADQSAFDAKLGVRITAIFSGAHKNDMSPHAPLDDETRAWLQQRMDSMRTLFASSVAKYRGMEVEAVLATEAQVYQGQDCVNVGLADRIGTYYDLMQELAAGPATESEQPGAGGEYPGDGQASNANVTETKSIASDDALAAAFAAAVVAAGARDALAVALIARGHQNQDAPTALAYANEIRDACFAAGVETVAADYIRENTPIATVRAQLLDLRATGETEIVTALPKSESAKQAEALAQRLNTNGVYARDYEFLLSNSQSFRSFEKATIPSGQGQLQPGTLLTASNTKATDGVGAVKVLCQFVDATDVAVVANTVVRDAEVHGELLGWESDTTADEKLTAAALLDAKGIIVRWTSKPTASGAAHHLEFVTYPTSGTAGASLGNVVAHVKDAFGNTVTSSTASVTLAKNTGPGTLTNGGATSAVAGVATWTAIQLSAAGDVTLKATSAGLTQATGAEIAVTA
jgi:signal peptide peptidase SppA